MATAHRFTVTAALILLLLNGTARAQFISDDFSGATLNVAWTVTSKNPSSSVALNGAGALVITAVSPSDLWSGSNYDAPRVLQSTAGNVNWTIETKFDFAPATNYQGAGLLLKTGAGVDDVTRIAERAYFPDGGGQLVRSVGSYVGYSGSTTYFRVQKVGNDYTGWWSSDGSTWNSGGTATITASVSEVGVFAISNWGAPNSVVTFDYFTAVPEPSTYALASGLAALALVVVCRRRQQSPKT